MFTHEIINSAVVIYRQWKQKSVSHFNREFDHLLLISVPWCYYCPITNECLNSLHLFACRYIDNVRRIWLNLNVVCQRLQLILLIWCMTRTQKYAKFVIRRWTSLWYWWHSCFQVYCNVICNAMQCISLFIVPTPLTVFTFSVLRMPKKNLFRIHAHNFVRVYGKGYLFERSEVVYNTCNTFI